MAESNLRISRIRDYLSGINYTICSVVDEADGLKMDVTDATSAWRVALTLKQLMEKKPVGMESDQFFSLVRDSLKSEREEIFHHTFHHDGTELQFKWEIYFPEGNFSIPFVLLIPKICSADQVINRMLEELLHTKKMLDDFLEKQNERVADAENKSKEATQLARQAQKTALDQENIMLAMFTKLLNQKKLKMRQLRIERDRYREERDKALARLEDHHSGSDSDNDEIRCDVAKKMSVIEKHSETSSYMNDDPTLPAASMGAKTMSAMDPSFVDDDIHRIRAASFVSASAGISKLASASFPMSSNTMAAVEPSFDAIDPHHQSLLSLVEASPVRAAMTKARPAVRTKVASLDNNNNDTSLHTSVHNGSHTGAGSKSGTSIVSGTVAASSLNSSSMCPSEVPPSRMSQPSQRRTESKDSTGDSSDAKKRRKDSDVRDSEMFDQAD